MISRSILPSIPAGLALTVVVFTLASAAEPGVQPFAVKGDQLGMTLESFKKKYDRKVNEDDRAPFVSDTVRRIRPLPADQEQLMKSLGVEPLREAGGPNQDSPFLLYKKEYAQLGIVHATTAFPYEANARPRIVATIAGVETECFVYKFVDGKLFEILILVKQPDFAHIRQALIAKYGDPKTKQDREYQNAFGAKFVGAELGWNNGVSSVMASERAADLETSMLRFRHDELGKIAEERLTRAKPRGLDDL